MGLPFYTAAPVSTAGIVISKKYTRSRGRAKEPVDPYASAYGVIHFNKFRGRPWTDAHELDESMVGKRVLFFGTLRFIRPLSRARAMVVLLDFSSTVTCVIDAGAGEDDGVITRMVRFAVTRPLETPVDVEGVVVLLPFEPFATTQNVAIQVTKFHWIEVGQQRRSRASSAGIGNPRDRRMQRGTR
ncbi:hypothetical protein PR202_ga29053 [Eleusine coracana subsp. coracana]|uniref:Uncharacterized protein n=1 Tax=Eleusine coracana subsp. coracana TaxID=191504 RepID=A0AAV5DKP4_ELECO|nr:hypothetical protein PR202_ga29053 [Eleusine coracana subsp. coracana]